MINYDILYPLNFNIGREFRIFMRAKQIAILIVFLVFGLPILIQFLAWNANTVLDPSTENIEASAELMADAVTPWWVGIMEWFAGFPALLSAVVIIGLVLFIKWIGE